MQKRKDFREPFRRRTGAGLKRLERTDRSEVQRFLEQKAKSQTEALFLNGVDPWCRVKTVQGL